MLFYAPSLGEVTGGGRVVVDWAAVAAARGCRVTIATPDGRDPAWRRVDGLTVVERDRVRERPDLVVATIWWTAWHADRWRRRGVRAVHLLQDDERLWATRADQERVVRAAHALIPTKVAVSRWVAERCAPPGDTVHVVPPAVAVPAAEPRPRPGRPGPVVVGLPYRNFSAKGWRTMDAVAGRLRHARLDVRFRVWGPGAPAAVGGRYRDVHEPASDAELLALYDSCDIVLHTSWHDGFPLPPIEAMARRAAVVATGTGGVREYAVDGENCLLAAPGDVGTLAAAVERLAGDADLRARLVEGGVETARRYSRERFAESATRTLDLLAA